jgi:hypothetical protein
MKLEGLDYLKLSFTEFFTNNSVQVAWYNINEKYREIYYPKKPKTEYNSSFENAPKTEFKKLGSVDGLPYAIGYVYYCNWPVLFNKEGNRKLFFDKAGGLTESCLMANSFTKLKSGVVKSGVLLASLITHDRKHFYKAEERREV